MNVKLLKQLSRNSRVEISDLAVMLGLSEEEVKAEIAAMEDAGLIRGYKAVIDWDRLDNAYVSAIIELKVTPKAGLGFEDVAAKVMRYPEVESVYLMSGGFDLAVMLRGKTMREVAIFVAAKLATIEAVTSTATHFVLRKYKDHNVIFGGAPVDERGNIL